MDEMAFLRLHCEDSPIRGFPFSTYVLRGEGGLKKLLISAYDRADRLREMRTRGREGVKNPENFAYVLNGSPLTTFLYPRRASEANEPWVVKRIVFV